jgi:class 3 adenylate cyclase
MASLTICVFSGGVLMLELGVLLPSADPVLAAPAAFAVGWAARIMFLDRQARAIRREFGKYLAPALIERMLDQRTLPELGGESRDVTIMFADLSGFTRLSTEIPERQLMQVLNEYLDRCAGIVQRSGGYVDKFIGDAVMAVWNAPADLPHHAREAVLAGLEITRAVDQIHAANTAAGKPGLKIKISINTGTAIVGNVGSRDRMNYTVVGSAVNVAARMEDLPRIFATPVVLGTATAQAVEEDFVILPVATVRLEGIGETMEIYAPLVPSNEATVTLRALIEEYARARSLADAGRIRQAMEVWDRLARLDWPGSGPSGAMLRQVSGRREAESSEPLRLKTDGLAS